MEQAGPPGSGSWRSGCRGSSATTCFGAQEGGSMCAQRITTCDLGGRQQILVDAHCHPQMIQAEANTALDGANRRGELGGNLGMAQAAEVGQLDRLLLLGR